MERLFAINNDALLSKTKDFIYVYSVPERPSSVRFLPNMPIILDHEEPFSWDIIQEHVGIDKLRGVSNNANSPCQTAIQDINQRIETFLIHMCSGSKEASLNLERILNDIFCMGEQSFYLKNVKRLTGILAATILVNHCQNEKQDDSLSQDMRRIFEQNMRYYNSKDKDYLITIFWQHNEYDGLLRVLRGLANKWNETQAYPMLVKAFLRICEMYNEGIYSTKYTDRAKEGEIFIRKCEGLFKNHPNEKKIWHMELAKNLFNQHKYEEAKEAWDLIPEENNDLSMLYNGAVFYAWVAEKKEKSGDEWNKHILKAMDYVDKGIAQLPEYAEAEDIDIKGHRIKLCLEKSFLLSEQEKYDEAYELLKTTYKIAGSHVEMEYSNYNTHFWIIMQYLVRYPLEMHKIISDMLQSAKGNYYRFPTEYYKIFKLVEEDAFLKENSVYQENVCKSLLIALLYAQEIKHISKIRDLSQYHVVYYTKLNNLKLLLEDEENGEIWHRLPLFHAYHMNDPQEGRLLYSYLYNKMGNAIAPTDERVSYEENYVFLKSFFSYPQKGGDTFVREFLPMWVQYGDEAQGCCITLNSKTFENCQLRRVTYLSDDWTCDNEKMNNLLKSFKEAYGETQRICKEISRQNAEKCAAEIQGILEYVVSQIAYLFKHDSYKHENEVRIIKTLSDNDVSDIRSISGEIPRLYVYNDVPTFIDEIILGARVKNPEEYVPFLCTHGRKMWGSKTEKQIKITHSSIQYR